LSDKKAGIRIEEIFEQLNLTELGKRQFAELSTGNKQRLAVARALLPEPPVLLLDEPTRSLDPLAAAEMRVLIRSLENVSVLLTSHNLSEVEELCNRVAIISRGEIRDVDTPKNLRLMHKQTQKVKIIFGEISEDVLNSVVESLSFELPNYKIENHADIFSLVFEREVTDDLLGKTISYLTAKGAKILDIETEKPTLLDVLESYE
jgi:ABC-2 type transport system ATP-binding protein